MPTKITFRPLLIAVLALPVIAGESAVAQDKPAIGLENRQVLRQPAAELKALDARRLSRDFSMIIDKSEYSQAASAYERAVAETDTREQRATIDLSYANSLAKRAKRDKNPELLETADKHYLYAIEHGDSGERVAAINNYATTALKLGDGAKAVALFEKGYAQAEALDNPAARARYLYNYGNALAEQGRTEEAFKTYLRAYRTNSGEQAAAGAGLRLAIETKDPRAGVEITEEMIAQGHLAMAEAALRRLLSAPDLKKRKDFVAVIETLYDHLLAARVDERTYDLAWSDFIKAAAEGMHERARSYLTMVPLAYHDLPVIVAPYEVREEFAPWAGSAYDAERAARILRAPSGFLAGVGEIYASQGRWEQALARYLIAWGLDNSNLEAGQFAANLLFEYRDRLDPDKQLLDEFVFHLFEGKGQAYLGEDYPAIFRFHAILASIYVRDEVWGDSYNPRGAIFQLEHALRARERIKDPMEKYEAMPGLYAMLGRAYDGVGDEDKAFESYLLAAREAMRLYDNERARDYLDKARQLSYKPDPTQQKHLQRLEQAVG